MLRPYMIRLVSIVEVCHEDSGISVDLSVNDSLLQNQIMNKVNSLSEVTRLV